jgi:UDP-N-acetylmuramate--alanine ligase
MIRMPGLFDRPRRAHLVGAGGVGMSSLGQALLHEGHRVTGSDASDSARTKLLRKLGAEIHVGHARANLPADCDLVVVTAAVDRSNPEVAAALVAELPIVKYAQALGELMARKHGICVAGCHGKTTTTGLLTTLLVRGGCDPTMVVGGDAASLGGSFRAGRGPHFVAEACEFDRSFLSLAPRSAIVTNIDADHLDYYRDIEEIQGAFQDFARMLPVDGYLATLNEHERVFRDAPAVQCEIETFGLRGNADWVASEWRRADGVTYFRVKHRGDDLGVFELRLAGLHNVCNALGAMAVASHVGLDLDGAVRPALMEYRGVDRRMTVRYEGHGVLVLDDYAHHPREIAAVLTTLREEFPARRIVVVFQAHQASRTRTHLREFATALELADRVFVPDIFCARDSEEDRRAVHALDLVRTAANRGVDVTYVEDLSQVAPLLLQELRVADLVVTMGAGNVSDVSRDIAERLCTFDRQVIAP